MTGTRLAPLIGLVLILTACGGATPATQQLPGATRTPAGPTSTPAQATSPPAAGGDTIVVVVGNGPDAGTYRGGADPHCSYDFVGDDVWGVAYVDELVGGTGAIGALNVIAQAASPDDGSRSFGADFWFGNPAEAGTQYKMTREAGDETQTVDITDNGTTAVIHVAGISQDRGAAVDMTVTCPSVTRG